MQFHFLSCTSESPSGVAIGALVVSSLALCWNIFNYFGNKDMSRYATLDKALADLVRDTMIRPDFRNSKWISAQVTKEDPDNDYLAYEAHAAMCLNLVETAIKNYGYKVMKTHFGPSMRTLLRRHQEMYNKWKEDLQPLERLYKEMA